MLWGRRPFIGQVQKPKRLASPLRAPIVPAKIHGLHLIGSMPIGIHGKNGTFTHNFTVDFYCKLVGKYTSPVGGMGCAFHVFQTKKRVAGVMLSS